MSTVFEEHIDESVGELDIAIIGMAGRFPGASDIEAFWQNLRQGRESISFFSDQELLAMGVDPAVLQNPHFIKASPLIKDIDQFDAAFFGYAPSEAALIDPQQRLFLECAWEALEHANCDPERFDGLIGVYAGTGMSTYLLFNVLANPTFAETEDTFPVMVGNDKDFLSTRVSYTCNLRGPSVTLQTGCSTALVSLHMACQALQNYQCDLALAGGVSLDVSHTTGYFYQESGIVSPDGHCRAFDADSQGTIFGSGVGVVAVKRLRDALEAGDLIHAVIKGTAMNNDGAMKVGYTAPGVEGQADVIVRAQGVADVSPETIGYIEAHGTGTPLGDLVELSALNQAFRAQTDKTQFCALGSVKTNVGHLDIAAGVAGLIKTVLALKHHEIPATLHFQKPHPQLDFARSPFYVNAELQPWPEGETPRRAGVSSFGIGGTNVHVILEEAPAPEESGPSGLWQILPLSARTVPALKQAMERLAEHLREHPEQKLADVAYSLQQGRKAFTHRRALLCRTHAEAIEALTASAQTLLDGDGTTWAWQQPDLMLVIPSQRISSADFEDLSTNEPVFRETVERCLSLLTAWPAYQLSCLLNADQRGQSTLMLEFIFSYALAQVWLAWGLQPKAYLGSGAGEFVAGCLAGSFSLKEILHALVAYERTLPQGISSVKPDPFQDLTLQIPALPCLSHRTGDWISEEEAQSVLYWAEAPISILSEQAYQTIAQTFEHPFCLELGTFQPPARMLGIPAVSGSDEKGLLTALGQLWSSGVPINWRAFAAHERRRFCVLPTYPFERQRYWIEPHKQRGTAFASTGQGQTNKQPGRRPDISEWFFAPGWTSRPLYYGGSRSEGLEASDIQAPCLVFVDRDGLGEALVQLLHRQDLACIQVTMGHDFQISEDGQQYSIDPYQSESYDRLVEDLQTKQRFPSAIYYCWSLAPETRWSDGDSLAGYRSLIFLARALVKASFAHLDLTVVTSDLFNVSGIERIVPHRVSFLAPCLVLTQEYPQIASRCVDLSYDDIFSPRRELLLEQLLAEKGEQDILIAYRGQRRWTRSFEPLALSRGGKPLRELRAQGVYVILGGFGQVGYQLATFLAQKVQARLVLVGRTAVSERDQWERQLSSHEPGDALVGRIQQLQALESAGAQVEAISLDIADAYELKRTFTSIYQRYGEINGVIHAVGTGGVKATTILPDATESAHIQQIQAKMAGLAALDQALHGFALDFCFLISSNAAHLGGAGLTSYTVANMYLDAFVQCHNEQSPQPWISTNWDMWEVRKQDGSAPGVQYGTFQYVLTYQECCRIFEQIIQGYPVGQVIISSADIQARFAEHCTLKQERGGGPQTGMMHARPELQTPYVAPSVDLERRIVEVWQSLLGIERIGIDDNFFELGGTSLIGIHIIARLKQELGLEIADVLLFEGPTVRSLAQALIQENTSQTPSFEYERSRGAQRRERRLRRQ
ncbi:MAG TPA: beta-ketoacyl synthase N-terminal-like domain-containing protein [Ktedonobacteraceae bacterium]|nr:beta-ketoacyl synthase N-terminal-like domain-containing protein [Ktedonobacteraceae bacterium]